MIKIWFEPHATSLDNEADLASGWNDVDLSTLGLVQASELIERNIERKIDAIFVSDLQRAIKTAVPFAEKTGVPIYVDRRLRECNYGKLTQQPKLLLDNEKPSHIDTPFENGESYSECLLRMSDFMKHLKNNFDEKTVLIIGHRATQYGIENVVLGRPILDSLSVKWNWQPGWEYD
jgi:broad specificity phosphatase PhoE